MTSIVHYGAGTAIDLFYSTVEWWVIFFTHWPTLGAKCVVEFIFVYNSLINLWISVNIIKRKHLYMFLCILKAPKLLNHFEKYFIVGKLHYIPVSWAISYPGLGYTSSGTLVKPRKNCEILRKYSKYCINMFEFMLFRT